MRRDRLLFEDILESIDFILKYIEGMKKDEFINNELVRNACLYKLVIIGEATNKISKDIKSKYNRIEWAEIISFRNYVIHEYFGIHLNTVWNTMVNDLPEYRDDIEKILINEKENI